MDEINPWGFKKFQDTLKSDPKIYAKWREVWAGFGSAETKGDSIMKSIGILDPQNKRSKYFCFNSNLLK